MSVKKTTTLPKSIEIYLEKKKSPSIIQDNTGYYRTIKSVKQ